MVDGNINTTLVSTGNPATAVACTVACADTVGKANEYAPEASAMRDTLSVVVDVDAGAEVVLPACGVRWPSSGPCGGKDALVVVEEAAEEA